GAGKSQLAQRVYKLRKQRSKLEGGLVAVNCATLRGENAMSALFGHNKGAFTGAATDRPGLLREANNGLLFLDEVGELGLDEQAMLLRAIEDKRFMPLGSDKEVSSDFQLIAGTNRDLAQQSREGLFREDLLARIDLWTYQLPSLKERIEDLEPNIDFELESFSGKSGYLVKFNKIAREKYLSFSRSAEASWSANFRDLNASITRMGTLADGGRITAAVVDEEINRLRRKWKSTPSSSPAPSALIEQVLGSGSADEIDYYDQLKLASLIEVCQHSSSMAEAGRKLFNISRKTKRSSNDSHRVKQLLAKHGLQFEDLKATF
ncbi:MAG: sigma 54-interacting transcriptional regulator, partial [Pseudomonadota bacterium]|nr:sigma 54-interacting transcriptional regulator [Pseudomonadota bacterium]